MYVKCFYGISIIFHTPVFYIIMSSLYVIIAIPTIILNLLVLVAIWKTPSLHKPSYVLLANIAVADFMNGVLFQPLMVLNYVAMVEYRIEMHCTLAFIGRLFGYYTSGISILTLAAISVDRLLASSLKNRYHTVVTLRRVICFASLSWAVLCILALVIGVDYSTRKFPLYMIAMGIIVFALLVIIVICYSMAYYHLKNLTCTVSPNNGEDTVQVSSNMTATKYRKILNTMVIVCAILLLFYVPFFISSIIVFKVKDAPIEEIKLGYIFWRLGELIIVSNSAINPVLYLWRMRDLRAAVNTIARGIFCGKCTEAAQ